MKNRRQFVNSSICYCGVRRQPNLCYSNIVNYAYVSVPHQRHSESWGIAELVWVSFLAFCRLSSVIPEVFSSAGLFGKL